MQKYKSNLQDAQGRAIPNAPVTVVFVGTNTKATLYSDNGITTTLNPVRTNAQGEFEFYVANGRYSLLVSAPGFTTESEADVILAFDPDDTDIGDITGLREDLDDTTDVANDALSRAQSLNNLVSDAALTPVASPTSVPTVKNDDGAVTPVNDALQALANNTAYASAQLASSNGAAMVGFTQAGTGAVLRTTLSKNRDIVVPADYGAAGDGSTDDSTPVTRTLTNALTWIADANKKFSVAGLALTAARTIIAARLIGSSSSSVAVATGGTNIKLLGFDVEASAGPALQINTTGTGNIQIVGSRFKTAGNQAFLANQNAATYGVTMVGILAESANDGVNLNHPNETSGDFTTVGALLQGGASGTSDGNGFSYAVSGTQGHILMGSISRYSRREAIHFEKAQKRGVAIGNIGLVNFEAHRFLHLDPADPAIFMGNHYGYGGSETDVYGVRIVTNTNGYQTMGVMAGNIMTGYSRGYGYQGRGIMAAGDNVAASCSIGLENNGRWLGTIYAKSCAQPATGANASVTGRIVSDTHTLTPLARSSTSTAEPGLYCKGIFMPFSIAHTGDPSTQTFPILTLTSTHRMRGDVHVLFGGGARGLSLSARVVWNGSTLTVTETLSRGVGGFTSGTFVHEASDNSLRLSFYSTASASFTATFDFDGYFFVP